MARRAMQRIRSAGWTFAFVVDDDGELHVTYREGITPKVAIDTFLRGSHIWNEQRKRYETYTTSHGIYWTWLYGDETSTNVLVLSCFPNPNQGGH